MPEEIELDVDPLELAETLQTFRQGDVLDIARMTWLFSPDHPLNPTEEVAEAEGPVMAQGRLSESGLAIIVSQTCDIWRLPDVEPFVTLCPLIELDESRHAETSRNMSVRYFPYPTLPDCKHQFLAVDGRIFFSLEKTALQSAHIQRLDCPLSGPGRIDLRLFLAQRLGRPDLPDEVVRDLIGPIEQGFKRVHSKRTLDRFFQSVIYYGIRWTPQAPGASVLVLTSPARRQKNRISKDDVAASLKQLRKSLAHWTRNSPYEVGVLVHDADQVSASEILSHIELRLDLEAASLDG